MTASRSASLNPQVSAVRLGCCLAATAGSVDLLSYTALGPVFSSIVTGNLVLAGGALAQADWPPLVHAIAAVAAYALGVVLGSALTRGRQRRKAPAPVITAELIACEVLAVAILAAVWMASGGAPLHIWQYLALTAAALAMGLQSAAFRLVNLRGVTTTYFTGTLTGLLAGLVQRRQLNLPAATALAALLAGATATGLALQVSERLSVLVPALLSIVSAVLARGRVPQ